MSFVTLLIDCLFVVCCVCKYMGILLWKMFFLLVGDIELLCCWFVCLFELNWSHFRGLKKLPIIDF
jgi:hypothetical protein